MTMPKRIGNINRKRVIEALVFLTEAVRRPNKTLLYKMLAELDFRHFTETGFPTTNLVWIAFPRGPVPARLHEEITKGTDVVLPEDLEEALSCKKTTRETKDGEVFDEFVFSARRRADLTVFTPRQVRILAEVAEIYKLATATLASAASHEPNAPWTKTVRAKGEGAEIVFVDSVPLPKGLTKEKVLRKQSERRDLEANYSRQKKAE
jgi:hypothetical protein